MAQKRVILFTAPGCVWCTRAEQFFKKNRVKFKKIDISRDPRAAKDCERHGCRGVPVILIGSKWICGFNEGAIRRELGL
ncbi:MAG: glutaredoxin family protein [Campylobacterales bacterium]